MNSSKTSSKTVDLYLICWKVREWACDNIEERHPADSWVGKTNQWSLVLDPVDDYVNFGIKKDNPIYLIATLYFDNKNIKVIPK